MGLFWLFFFSGAGGHFPPSASLGDPAPQNPGQLTGGFFMIPQPPSFFFEKKKNFRQGFSGGGFGPHPISVFKINFFGFGEGTLGEFDGNPG